MSIYIGEDATDKVLHIYDGSLNIEKNLTTGTSFHSSLPYVKVRSRHVFLPNATIPYAGSASSSTWTSRGYVTQTAVDLANSEFSICIGYIGSNRTFFPASMGYSSGLSGVNIPGFMYGNPWANVPCFSLSSSTTGFTTSITHPSLYPAYPTLSYDKIEIIIFDDYAVVSEVNDIVIDNSQISINGNNIIDDTYCHFLSSVNSRINDYDDIIAIPFLGSASVMAGAAMIAMPNYVSSSSNTQFSNMVSGGNYFLVQLINSYPYTITSVSLSSVDSTISVVKNTNVIALFSANSIFKVFATKVAEVRIIPYGYTVVDNGTYNVQNIPVTVSVGAKVLMSLKVSSSVYQQTQILTSCGLNESTYIFSGGLYSHIRCDVTSSQLRFYYVVYDNYLDYTGYSRSFNVNVFAKFTIMY